MLTRRCAYGLQEFNLEKLNLLESEKQRIRKEFERKEAQVESSKKMCVHNTLCSCLPAQMNKGDVILARRQPRLGGVRRPVWLVSAVLVNTGT